MPYTTAGANSSLDTALNNSYISLYSVMPTLAGGGTELAVTRVQPSWNAASSRSKSTSSDCTFSAVPAGNIVAWAAFTASSGGSPTAWGPVTTPVTAEAATLVSGLVQVANHSGGISPGETVKDSTNTTTYTRGTDYEVDYETGTFIRLAGGAITSSQVLHITYAYPVTITVTGVSPTVTLSAGNIAFYLYGDQ